MIEIHAVRIDERGVQHLFRGHRKSLKYSAAVIVENDNLQLTDADERQGAEIVQSRGIADDLHGRMLKGNPRRGGNLTVDSGNRPAGRQLGGSGVH